MTKNKTPTADGLPSHEELDALQAQIDKAAKAVKARQKQAQNDEAGEDSAKPNPKPKPEPKAELSLEDQQKARIEELEAELAKTKDQALRALAETDNVKKRAEREVRAASKYAVERFAADMLSVSDNLSRALMTIDEKARGDMGPNAKNLLDGLELTEKDLIAVFSRHGIKPVPGVGAKFDPNVHQAVAQIPSSETKGDVAQVMQTGFTLGERTLRAAMVAVSTGPEKK